MRTMWIDSATYERACDAIDAALTPRDGLWAGIKLRQMFLVSRGISRHLTPGDHGVDIKGFMAFLAMLAAPRPLFELFETRAFGVPVDKVNAIGRLVLGEGWAGIGALTMCDDGADGGLTLTCDAGAGALEMVR